MQVCGKLASFAQGSRGLWKTQKVNTVYKKLTQNSRELNIYKFLTFLTQNLHLTQTLLNLNKNLINTILTQNLQDLNTENRAGGTRSVPPAEKSPRARHSRQASCKLGELGGELGKLRAGFGCYTSKTASCIRAPRVV